MKSSLLLLVQILFITKAFSQQSVEVTESTLKVGGLSEEIFYFGFAEGDQLIIDFNELKGKELKELEIIELPSSSKFMEYRVRKITNKKIQVTRSGIYKFRFYNSALNGRICKFHIQRIPANESTRNFNTNVYWKTVYDTTYTPRTERYLAKSDTSAIEVVRQTAKVSSQTALNGNSNKTVVDFELPEGTITWSYYIGVGREGRAAYEKATEEFFRIAAQTVSTISGYGTMAALALYGINSFSKINGSDNVKYWFITDWNNVQKFESGVSFLQYKQGDVINDAAQMKAPLQGKVYLGLLNDNIMEPIEVMINVTAIQVKQTWSTRTVQQVNVSSREVAYLEGNKE